MSEVELYLGDCLEIMPMLTKIDAIITDIPYGTTACSWDEVIPLVEMWRQIKRLTGIFITTANQPFTSKLVMSNLAWYRHQWQWIKNQPTGALNASYAPMKANEDILVFGVEKVPYYPIMVKRTEKEYKKTYRKNNSKSWGNNIQGLKNISLKRKPKEEQWFKYPTNILEIKRDDKRNGTQHPTQKPVALYEYLIRTYTNEDDIVLDFCFGSGTTGVACVQTRRNFIGIEIEPKYFEIAEKRIAEAQLQMRMSI